MKPHVRYGTKSTTGSVGDPPNVVRRSGTSEKVTMIEEYKLEDQHLVNTLAPFYEGSGAPVTLARPSATASVSSSLPSPAFRSFLPSSSSGKPTLRTVSIMETLSELAGAGGGGGGGNRAARRAPVAVTRLPTNTTLVDATVRQGKSVTSSKASLPAASNVKRKKVLPSEGNSNVPPLLDFPQLYSKQNLQATGLAKRGVTAIEMNNVKRISVGERVWDVTRLSSKLGLVTRKGRSVEDILATQVSAAPKTGSSSTATSSSAHGYGSLERRRRRRPGTRTDFAVSARRGETDWEREEDEEEESLPGLTAAIWRSPNKKNLSSKLAPSIAATVGHAAESERGHATYKLPTEWFKKKRAQLSVKSAIKERGQTPDWIHKIFDVARRGNLLKLQRIVTGMEPTLVRNLSDHRGNNLLHVLAGAGNADALAWLCSSFGPEMQDALVDENKRGLTPVIAAIQTGRLEALQFLVEHTSARERLAPVDGDRSLLHIAAKYGKVDLVAWLAQYMETHGYEIDLRDHCGHTPLHLAARAGHASAVAILVAHGADVTAKNDMGHRPLDLASAHGHVGVAQLLRLHDAALSLAAETLEANEELDNIRGDYAELKSYFRDVLVVGKRLAKERDEMCRQLGRLYEDVTSLHQALLIELRALHRDLAGMRDRVNGSRKAGEMADRNLDESVAVVEALHERWQNQQRSWFSSSLADMEHRLLVAEDGWKRLRTSNSKHRSCQIQPHELLRNRLAAVNAQASNCDIGMLSTSEGSLYSADCHSRSCSDVDEDTDANVNQVSQCGSCFSTAMCNVPHVPHVPSSAYKSSSRSVRSANRSPSQSQSLNAERDIPFENDAVYNTLQAAVRKMTGGIGEQQVKDILKPVTPDIDPVVASREVENGNKKKSSRHELRKKLQEVKLTSESGNASVIEVIEPSSSEADEDPFSPGYGRPQDQSTPVRPFPKARSFNASFSEELEKARQSKSNRSATADQPNLSSTLQAATDREGPCVSSKSYGLAEPDLLAGTVIREMPSVSPCNEPRHELADAPESEGDIETDYEQVVVGSNGAKSNQQSAISSTTSVARKRGGFLTKFALKARWSSKRKSNSEVIAPTESQSSESPDLSMDDPSMKDACEGPSHNCADSDKGSTSVASGVVAGLSQMFEDMSKTKQPSSNSSTVVEKRGPSRSSATSVDSDGGVRSKNTEFHDIECNEERTSVIHLPSAASPPSVAAEMDSYASSPSSQETTLVSPCNRLPVNETGRSLPHPPPPPRLSSHLAKSSGDLSKDGTASSIVTPSSSSSSSTSTSHGGMESLSVAASEDSGIVVARPASSASKSDSLPRPGASSYSFATLKSSVGFPLRKASSVSGELPTPDSSLGSGDRLSPAPSEISKTESALSPPSHASDLSKTESLHHFRQLARIEETAASNGTAALTSQSSEAVVGHREENAKQSLSDSLSTTVLLKKTDVKVASVVDMAAQSGQILTWREAKLKNQVITPPPLEDRLLKARIRLDEKNVRTLKKRQLTERPWYDVSDDESDLLSPERLTKLKSPRSSSEEDTEV